MINKLYITLLVTICSPCFLLAQCTGGTLDGAIVPTVAWQTVTTHSHKYFTFSATAGTVYIFSYCPCEGGSITYAGELSLDSTNTLAVRGNADFVNHNIGYCGGTSDGPRISWKCFATGTYRVLTTHQFCSATSGTTATMAYKMQTPALCYTLSSITYAPDIFNTGTAVPGMNIDDGISPPIAIGFPFCFNGTTYDSLLVSSNGYITFIGSCPTTREDITSNTSVESSYTIQNLPFSNTTYTPFIGPGVLFPWIDTYPIRGGKYLL